VRASILGVAALLLPVGLACSVLESARLGVMGGTVGAADGDHDIAAVTLSVEPFAAQAPTDHRLVEALAQRDLARKQRDEYALMVAAVEGHTCAAAPTPEHIAPHHPRWWEDDEFLLWVSGFATLICGFIFRRPLGAVARKAVGRGDHLE